LTLLERYPNCTVDDPSLVRDYECRGSEYNTPKCNDDDGDCNTFNSIHPNCTVVYPASWIGDGYCDGSEFHSLECGWGMGGCDTFYAKYLICTVEGPWRIGDVEIGFLSQKTALLQIDDSFRIQ
jgi:hypothetical protein